METLLLREQEDCSVPASSTPPLRSPAPGGEKEELESSAKASAQQAASDYSSEGLVLWSSWYASERLLLQEGSHHSVAPL